MTLPGPAPHPRTIPTGSVDVVLPCLDEEAALPTVLRALPEGYRAVVVDNGSRDRSVEVATAWGATVVHEARRGYGAAVHTGLQNAEADLVAVIDADGTLDPAALAPMVAMVRSGAADLVCGRRRPTDHRVWPWHARLGTLLLADVIRAGTGVAVHDIAPVRVARREGLLALGLTDRRSGYPLETLLAASAHGWRVVEVDVDYRRRAAGSRSKVSGTVRGTLTVARDFFGVLWRRRHQLRGHQLGSLRRSDQHR